MKNAAIAYPEQQVSGMLLYARTIKENQPDERYLINGNEILVRTLDLGCKFSIIKDQLDNTAIELLSEHALIAN